MSYLSLGDAMGNIIGLTLLANITSRNSIDTGVAGFA